MSRVSVFVLFYSAVFLQAGAYGLTFMLPRLFENFGADEKTVGAMLFITTIATLGTVYYSGHLADKYGRIATLGMACLAIAISLFLFAWSNAVEVTLVSASVLLGFGWGLTYSLAPVVLTRLVSAEERIRQFALLSVFVMAGFGMSPVLAAGVESAGYSVNGAFYITAGLCLVSAFLFFILITPIRQNALNAGPEATSRLSSAAIQTIWKSRARLPVIMVCIGASVFAGMNNFQTVFADERGLDYATYFLAYTITVVIFRIALARFKGGASPYLTIAGLLFTMCASIVLFLFIGGNAALYTIVAILFGIGYGVSYPILVAMAANDAEPDLVPQTLQLFALSYFIGVFGFPLVAGWVLVEIGTSTLLVFVSVLAAAEALMASRRALANKRAHKPNQIKLN